MKTLFVILVCALLAGCGDPGYSNNTDESVFYTYTSCDGMAHKALPYRYKCK